MGNLIVKSAEACVALAVVLLVVGCQKETPRANPAPAGGGGVENVGAHVERGKERQVSQNDLVQLATFYNQYTTEMGHPPASLAEFKPYIQRDASKILKAIEDGQIVVIWKTDPSTNSVLAYEKEPDLNGNQVVTMGDKSTKLMRAEELKALLQNKGG